MLTGRGLLAGCCEAGHRGSSAFSIWRASLLQLGCLETSGCWLTLSDPFSAF